MEVTLLYLDGCPNWHAAEANLRTALAAAWLVGHRRRDKISNGRPRAPRPV